MSSGIAQNASSSAAGEEVIDPDLPIVDSHIHLWNMSGFDYFAPEFLADAKAGHNVEGSIYVECGMSYSNDERPQFRPVGETAYVVEQAAQSPEDSPKLAAGILGSADLVLGVAVQPVLEAHIAAGKGRFGGIRARVARDVDPEAGYSKDGYPQQNVLIEDAFLEGARCVGKLGLVLDVWAFHTQLDDLRAFAAKCPELPVVVEHIGGPLGVGRYAGRREEVFEAWASGMRKLAELPNTYVKLSGLGISRLGFRFHGGGQAASSDELVQAWKPYIGTCLDAFGPARSIFGSNFPVDLAAAPYPMLLNAFKKMLSSCSEAERRAIFAGNARRLYKIG